MHYIQAKICSWDETIEVIINDDTLNSTYIANVQTTLPENIDQPLAIVNKADFYTTNNAFVSVKFVLRNLRGKIHTLAEIKLRPNEMTYLVRPVSLQKLCANFKGLLKVVDLNLYDADY